MSYYPKEDFTSKVPGSNPGGDGILCYFCVCVQPVLNFEPYHFVICILIMFMANVKDSTHNKVVLSDNVLNCVYPEDIRVHLDNNSIYRFINVVATIKLALQTYRIDVAKRNV